MLAARCLGVAAKDIRGCSTIVEGRWPKARDDRTEMATVRGCPHGRAANRPLVKRIPEPDPGRGTGEEARPTSQKTHRRSLNAGNPDSRSSRPVPPGATSSERRGES